ncbi:hypothetical protein Tco_0215710 [Tanacetum coccineum]
MGEPTAVLFMPTKSFHGWLKYLIWANSGGRPKSVTTEHGRNILTRRIVYWNLNAIYSVCLVAALAVLKPGKNPLRTPKAKHEMPHRFGEGIGRKIEVFLNPQWNSSQWHGMKRTVQNIWQGDLQVANQCFKGSEKEESQRTTDKHPPNLYKMSQPANDDFSQHLSDEESNHEDASDTSAAYSIQHQ